MIELAPVFMECVIYLTLHARITRMLNKTVQETNAYVFSQPRVIYLITEREKTAHETLKNLRWSYLT